VISILDIVSQLKKSISSHKNIDVITFTANGEPTLYPYLNKLIDEVDKIKGDIKTLILSNGANIYNKDIQTTLSKIDIVKLSLDCISKECFKKLDRVDSSIEVDKIVGGMVEFRKLYQNDLIIEILFVDTINNKQKEIEKLVKALQTIQPNRVDIGTIDRPPAYDVEAISYQELQDIASKFEQLPINITSKNMKKEPQRYSEYEIISMLKRRPLNKNDIENLFDEDTKIIFHRLLGEDKIYIEMSVNIEYFKAR
jgi:wyosine [tRNA(Phe)-imidazoG37] synthetase (radical SAM superfamily)